MLISRILLSVCVAVGIATTVLAQPFPDAVPSEFAAASPTSGLWKGWPIGTTVTIRLTLHPSPDMHSVRFSRVVLVGRSEDGNALLASYSGESEAGPWVFVRTVSGKTVDALHQPSVKQVNERAEPLKFGEQQIDCIVREFDGVANSRAVQKIHGEEWTIGPDGPPLKRIETCRWEVDGASGESSRRVDYAGQVKMAVGTQALDAFHTVETKLNEEGTAYGGNAHCYWSAQVPGWLVWRRDMNPDEQQPPYVDYQAIAFGADDDLLKRYVDIDHPPEAERAKLMEKIRAATPPTTAPTQTVK